MNSSHKLRAWSRRIGDETGTLTGIAELDEIGLTDGEDDEQSGLACTVRAGIGRPAPSWRHGSADRAATMVVLGLCIRGTG